MAHEEYALLKIRKRQKKKQVQVCINEYIACVVRPTPSGLPDKGGFSRQVHVKLLASAASAEQKDDRRKKKKSTRGGDKKQGLAAGV